LADITWRAKVKLTWSDKKKGVFMDKQFEAGPWDKLEVPAEVQKALRFKVLYEIGGRVSTAWCSGYQENIPFIVIYDACLDTSERVEGILLKKRVTLRPQVTFYNTPLIIFPLDSGEVGENGGNNGKDNIAETQPT
jgi:hypothetical protein